MKCVFVLFDSLNRHMLGAYGGTRIPTPNFDRLAARATTFDSHYVGSLPCMPARRDMQTGRLSFLHRSWGPMEPFDNSFPELLGAAGIYSHLVTDHFHYWEDGGATYHNRYTSYEFVRGQEGDPWKAMVQPHWERLREMYHARQYSEKFGSYPRHNIVNREFIREEAEFPSVQCFARGFEFLAQNRAADNWLLQIETFDPHEPFQAPARFKEAFSTGWNGPIRDWPRYGRVDELPEECEELRANYYATVALCDFLLGQLLDEFDRHGMWSDTALIVTTDHGFLLGEHDFWAKNRMNLYQEIAHIPLFIHHPSRAHAGERRAALTQTMDLAPSFLDLFGVAMPGEMEGHSLLSVLDADRALREAALYGYFGGAVNITDGHYTYHRFPPDLRKQEIYQYTLMPTHIYQPFSPEELSAASLAPPFPFTKGAPLLEVPVTERSPMYSMYGPGALLEDETRLYDLARDPGQEHPLRDEGEEARLVALMRRLMRANHAPAEAFARIGLWMAGEPITRQELRPLVGDLRQLASVRRIVLDDGPERGVRALAFSTGGGLDFWVLADRSLDLGPLWHRGVQLAWQAPSGFASPALLNRLDDGGRGIERWFSGLLMTCGLEHLRKPPGGVLHGHLPLTPARVSAYGEDWDRAEPVLFCEGEVTQSRVNGEAWRLHRRIEAPIGGSVLRIRDAVENLSAVPRPFGLMHHVNFGYPLVQHGARIDLDGAELITLDQNETAPTLRCFSSGSGWSRCTITAGGRSATLGYDGAVLRFLQLWHNLEAGTRVLAFEPCTSERLPDGSSGDEPVLQPGARKTVTLELSFA